MIRIYNKENLLTQEEQKNITKFLFTHLGKYGDTPEDINKAIDYVFSRQTPGGTILTAWNNDHLTGAVIVNKTGMNGYIPDNILVYIATHEQYRGKGIGKQLMHETITHCNGDIALHVEPDNPAKKLYESLGFKNKYLEMRLKKEN